MKIKSKYLPVIIISLIIFYSNEFFSQSQNKYGIKLLFTASKYYSNYDSREPARNPRFNIGFFFEGQNQNKKRFITCCFGLNYYIINGFIKADPEPCDNSSTNDFRDNSKCNLHYLSFPVSAKFNIYLKETTIFSIIGLQYNILLHHKIGSTYKRYSFNFSKAYTSMIIGLGTDLYINDKLFFKIDFTANKGLTAAYRTGYFIAKDYFFSSYEIAFGVGFGN